MNNIKSKGSDNNKEQKFLLNSSNVGIVYSFTIVAYFLFSLFGSLIISLIPMSEFLTRLVSGLYSVIVLGVAIVLFGVKSEGKITDNLSLKKFKPITLIFIIFIMCAMFFGLGTLNSLIGKLFNIESTPFVINSVWEYLAYVLTICILPAVVEELFFRGMVQRTMKPFGAFFSILISALLFSLYHFNVTQLLYQFVFGVIFGGLYYLTKSVLPGIILHFLNNFLVLTLIFFKVDGQANAFLSKISVIVSGCLILVGLIIYGAIKVIKHREEHVYDRKEKKYFLLTALMGVLVSVANIVMRIFV